MKSLFIPSLLLVASTKLCFSAVSITSASQGGANPWVAVGYQTPADPLKDQQTGGVEADLVGVGSNDVPFLYTLFDDNSTADKTDGTIAFRTRHGGDANSAGFSQVLFIGLELTGDSTVDAFIGVDNQGGSDLYIAAADTTGNNTIASLAIDSGIAIQQISYTDGVDYSWREITGADVTGLPNTSLDLDGDFDSKIAETDYLLSFSLDFNTLVTYADTNLSITIDEDTALRYIVGTSAQPNSFNQDIGGIDDNTRTDLVGGTQVQNLPFSTIGAFTDTITASGVPVVVPEPSTSALLLGSILFSCGFRRRK